MDTSRSQSLSPKRRNGFQLLSLTIAAFLALQPVAFTAPVDHLNAPTPAQTGFTYVVNKTGDDAGVGPFFQGCDTDPLTPGEGISDRHTTNRQRRRCGPTRLATAAREQ